MDKSGDNTKRIPEHAADKNMTMATGRTLISKNSSFFKRKIFHENGWGFSSVSLIDFTIKMEIIARIPDAKNNPSSVSNFVKGVPKNCPIPIPKDIPVPKTPIPCPRLSGGRISVINAVAPVGRKPVENPCINRRNKKKATLPESGYIKVTIIQIIVPMYMVLFLPTVSAIFPEKGREIAAEIVKREIISPLYSFPPR